MNFDESEIPFTRVTPTHHVCLWGCVWISSQWIEWFEGAFASLYFQQMCVNFFFSSGSGLAPAVSTWDGIKALEQIMLLKRKYFWIEHKRDTIQRQQKLTARLHENGDITEKLVGRCHLQDNAPIIMTVMKGELSRWCSELIVCTQALCWIRVIGILAERKLFISVKLFNF